MVTTNMWLRLWWKDPSLAWNATEWGVSSLNFDPRSRKDFYFWTPDMVLYNAGEKVESVLENTAVTASPDGSLFWSRPGLVKSTFKSEVHAAALTARVTLLCLSAVCERWFKGC